MIDKKIWASLKNLLLSKRQNKQLSQRLFKKDLKEKLALNFEKFKDEDEMLALYEKLSSYTVNTAHPHFNNQLSSSVNQAAFLGEILSLLDNSTMSTYESAPVGTVIEEELSNQLCKLIAFDKGEGLMTSGGSNSNLLALHLARYQKNPRHKIEGNLGVRYKIFISDQAHYSFLKAVNLIGLGLNSLVKVMSDSQGKMSVDELEKQIKICLSKGDTPLAIISTAGTTVLGAFDPIKQIDELAKKYNVWHHVDAAWGGPVLFSNKDLVAGIENVDSVTWDTHKLLSTALTNSFILVKEQGLLYRANSGGGESYLFHNAQKLDDLGPKSLQCGRKIDSYSFYFLWKSLGSEGIQKLVEKQKEKISYLYKTLLEHPRFRVVHSPEYLNLCFQVLPKNKDFDQKHLNEHNLNVRRALINKNIAYVNTSYLDEHGQVFRFVATNTYTQKKHIDELVSLIVDESNLIR